MKPKEDWSDEEFLGYVDLHSRTERALFHAEHVRRLYKMAGRPAPSGLGENEFVAVYHDHAERLIKLARKKMKPAPAAETEKLAIILQRWEESERGWGTRPDGYTLHLTNSDRDKFVEAFNKKHNNLPEAPESYTRTTGGPQPVSVVKDGYFHRQLVKEKTKHGIWGNPSSWPKLVDGVHLEDPPEHERPKSDPPRRGNLTLVPGDPKEKTCFACTHSYMEPDSPLICGHPDAGTFGLAIRKHPLDHCGWKKFQQHPLRNADGSLKR